MTPEKAIEAIKIEKISIEGKAERVAEFFEGLSVAKTALEKMMAKKPSWVDSVPHSRCPVCHNAVAVYIDSPKLPCYWCGQELDWGDVVEPKKEVYINVDKLSKLFASHSDYHGDTILSLISCVSEGKEVSSARPLDTDRIKLEAIKEYQKKLIYEIVNRPPEKAPNGIFYMNGRVDRQSEIIDIINELAGAYFENQKENKT